MECKEGEKMNIFGVISKYDNSGRLQAESSVVRLTKDDFLNIHE